MLEPPILSFSRTGNEKVSRNRPEGISGRSKANESTSSDTSTPQEAHQVHAAGVTVDRKRFRVPWAKAARRTPRTPH